MKKPILLIASELISILERNIGQMERNLYKIKEDTDLKEPIFLYAYAKFEGALTILMKKFCNAFPEKIPKEIFASTEKEDLIYNISNKEAIDNMAEKFVLKISYGNVGKWLQEFAKILGISLELNGKILNEISETRNCLTHNNGMINRKYVFKCSAEARGDIGKKLPLPETYVTNSIVFLIQILKTIQEQITKKYSKYNREYLIRSTWKYLFDSPLLEFEEVCNITEADEFYFNVEYLEEVFSELSSSEKMLLAVLIQQFSGTILDQLTRFQDIPMLAHMCSKEELYFIIDLFENYPLLFQN